MAAVDKDADRLTDLVEKMAADGLTAAAFPADVTDSGRINEVVDRIETELGAVDLLVNAAGVMRAGSALEMSDIDWRAIFSINLDGVFHCSRAVASRMKDAARVPS